MRLKKIEVFGFKSFADKTTVEFHPGITAIVGPNGCGKSNISDSFRWVLGEQSAKSMRGGKMQDVIFAGTSNRKPLNVAEVTITLTDVGGALPVEYEEVAVTRRLHRDGESEYLLNRQPVRLRDLQSLFLDSGMGKDAYAIFEQGKIDQVINYTPLDRRYIFEEAAGILRFLQRKRESMRKLEQMQQNMDRVKDIHKEVHKQIEVLQQQAEKARLFKEHKGQLENLEKGVAVAKWDLLKARLEEGNQKKIEAGNVTREASEEINSLKEEFITLKKVVGESEKLLQQRFESVYKVRNEQQLKNKEQQTNQQRLEELAARKQHLEKELFEQKKKKEERLQECAVAKEKQKGLKEKIKVMEQSLAIAREKVAKQERDVNKLREKQKSVQQEHLNLIQAESRTESDIKQHYVRQEGTQERISILKARQQEYQLNLKALKETSESRSRQVQEILKSVEKDQNKLGILGNQLDEINTLIAQKEEELKNIYREIAGLKARQEVLKRLKEEMEGFSVGSKKLLQESASAKSPLYKKIQALYELVKADNEKVLAITMRSYGQTLVVKTEADLKAVLSFASEKKLKDYSLICLEHLSSEVTIPDLSGNFKPLLKVKQPKCLEGHFLKNVYLTDDLQQAIEQLQTHPHIEIGIGEGLYIDTKQVLFHVSPGENNAFTREAEIQQLDNTLKKKEEFIAALETSLDHLGQKRTVVHNERLELDKKLRRSEMSHVEANFGLQQKLNEIKETEDNQKKIEDEKEQCQSTLEKIVETLKALGEQHKFEKNKVSDSEKLAVKLDKELEEKIQELSEDKEEWQQSENAFKQISEEFQRYTHTINLIEVQDQEGQRQDERLKIELEANRELQENLYNQKADNKQSINDTEKALKEVTSACSELEDEVKKKKDKLEKLEQKVIDKTERSKKLEKELSQIDIQLAQLEANSQAVLIDLKERYQLTIEEARALEIPLDRPLDQAEKLIRQLRQQIQQAGDINMTSIEEFEKNKERYEFLNSQINDLDSSKEELMGVINQLDDESRQQFKKIFDQIRSNFKRNFEVLFRGGEADLQFTDDGDILETGIEIIAKPPGKQMRSINLLSGGEKCLTAVALLFSVFEVKPSPFCILDEIDAPLDDSNVERFLNVVKQFVDRCQFIIITHNKRTMSIADTIFGVSMEEKGVSRLLSMKFSRQEADEAAVLVEA